MVQVAVACRSDLTDMAACVLLIVAALTEPEFRCFMSTIQAESTRQRHINKYRNAENQEIPNSGNTFLATIRTLITLLFVLTLIHGLVAPYWFILWHQKNNTMKIEIAGVTSVRYIKSCMFI